MLHCLPALSALRALFPDARIDWVAESLGAALIEGHPDLDRVIRLPRKEIARDLWRPGVGVTAIERGSEFLTTLREREYDLLLELQGNLRSGLVARAAHARFRIGHHGSETKEHRWLLRGSRPDQPAGRVHRVEKNLHVVRALGFTGPSPTGRLPEFTEEVEHFRPALASLGIAPTILHPFVSAFGRFKEWPEERFAALARALRARGHRVWLTAAPEDDARRDRILAASDGDAEPAPPTRSARELAALIRLSRGVIAADTGPLHLAAFAGVPVVGLFGPKDPQIYGPWSDRAAVRRGDVPCSPCTLRRCDHAICMQSIGVEAVLSAVTEVFPPSESALPTRRE